MQLISLKELRQKVNEKVIGQAALVDTITICLYRHMLKAKAVCAKDLSESTTNLLILGKTGTGKTFVVKQVAIAMDLPIIEINAKSISQEGWHGRSFINLIDEGISEINARGKDPTYSIVFIDEFDKICCGNTTSSGDNSNFHIQSGILKYMEGFSTRSNQMKNFCFVFAGAFSELFSDFNDKNPIGFANYTNELSSRELEEKLVGYGMLEEVLGRITRIVQTNDFTREMYKEMIFNKSTSFNQWLSLFEKIGFNYHLNLNYAGLLTEAEELDCGARGLIKVFEPVLDKILADNLDNPLTEQMLIEYLNKIG